MIKVLVVDDSAVVRRLVTTALASDPELEIVGAAGNGRQAIELVDTLEPDVVTLDIEMPEMDGLEALTRIRLARPTLPVIMFSTLTEHGARQTLDALARGAADYVTKPSGTGGLAAAVTAVRLELVPRVKALAGVRRPVPSVSAVTSPASSPESRPGRRSAHAVVVGCSTGGPDALARIFAELPAGLAVPMAVVQHMPPVFTRMLAERLDARSAVTVREAVDGDLMRPGVALLAPGDHHLRLAREGGDVVARLTQEPPENYCRPAVDVLFRSAAETYGGNVLAAVLTGMGHDGLRGAEALAARGASVVVQDEASSVVWGMPGAVAGAGLADEVLPLDRLAARLSLRSRGGAQASVSR